MNEVGSRVPELLLTKEKLMRARTNSAEVAKEIIGRRIIRGVLIIMIKLSFVAEDLIAVCEGAFLF